MELKFREVGEEFSVKANPTNKELKLKPFYTVQEMATIYNAMIGREEKKNGKEVFIQADSFDEYFTKIVATVRYCTNLDVKEMENENIFNLAMELKLDRAFSSHINQYSVLDNMMKREKSIDKTVSETLDKVWEKVENLDSKTVVEKFKDMLEKVLSNVKLADKKAK